MTHTRVPSAAVFAIAIYFATIGPTLALDTLPLTMTSGTMPTTRLPLFTGACSTATAGSAVFNCSGLLGAANTWSGAQTFGGGILGSASGATAIATGATTARTFADHLTDQGYSVLDFGAKCDGSTNDGTVIQAAVNAGASLGVEIIIAPRGRTCLVDSVGMRTNSHLRIDGTLKGAGNKQNIIAPYSFVYQTGGTPESNVVIEGDGVIDNGMPGGTGIPAPAGVACILGYGAIQYWHVSGLTLQNCGAWPFSIVGLTSTPRAGAAHIYFDNVKTFNNSNSAQFAEGCDDCWARHIVSRGSGDYPLSAYSNVTRSGFQDFDLDGGGGGVSVLMDGARGSALTSYPSSDITIGPGNINNQAGPGVYIQDNTTGSGAHALHSNIHIVSGTGGTNNNYNGNAYWGGIAAYYTNGLQIDQTSWSYDGGSHSGSTVPICGIYLDASVTNSQIIAPNIGNEAPTGGNGYGICSTGATYTTIIAPHIHDEQPTHTTIAAFYGTFGLQAKFYGGNYTGLTGGIGLPGLANVTVALGAGSSILDVPGVPSALANPLAATTLIANAANGQMQLGSTAVSNNPAQLAYSSGSTVQDFTIQFSGGTPGTLNKGAMALNGGNVLINAPLSTQGQVAASCNGPPTSAYVVTNGIVTHC